jgi:hypothetical protein
MAPGSVRRAAVVGVLPTVPLGLTACTDAGGTTCEEFTSQSVVEQTDTLHDLLSEHDLQPSDLGNIQGVSQAVSSLCAANPGAELDEASDWESGYWSTPGAEHLVVNTGR